MIKKVVTVELTEAEVDGPELISIEVIVKEKETGEQIIYTIEYPKE